jgi:hypothetical protein
MALGRTNLEFPEVWLSLQGGGQDAAELVDAALASGKPLEVSSAPALWGGHGAGKAETVMATGGRDLEQLRDPSRAPDLIGARLIEVLSGLGRPTLDIFIWQYTGPLAESVVDEVFRALESAREEGLVRFLALEPVGPPLASLAMWQIRDGFELLVARDTPEHDPLLGRAAGCRVGVVTRDGPVGPRLVPVRSANDVRVATG